MAVYYGGATVTANQISGNASAGVYVYGDAVDSTNFGVWTGDDTVFDDRLVNPGSSLGVATPGLSGDAFSFDGVSRAFQDTAAETAGFFMEATASCRDSSPAG